MLMPNSQPTLLSEEHSQRELRSTVVCRPVAITLALGFCFLLLIPAAVQWGAGRPLAQGQALSVPPSREELDRYSRGVDESSILKMFVQPRLQEALTKWGGFGNERVAVGRDGQLHYGPGLRAAYGRPFLEAGYLRAKAKGMVDRDGLRDVHPNPLPAFQQLAADCAMLGIRLIVVPAPEKAMVAGPGRILHNADFDRFRSTVTGWGAEFLPMEALVEARDAPWFLRQDTHWTPAFVERVAMALAARIGPGGGPPRYTRERRSVRSVGDLTGMLQLPTGQTLFAPEQVEVQRLVDMPADDGAEVLLLGDSFTNIYSSQSLDWGEKAGLGEQLAFHLNAPVRILARNGAGASVRHELPRAAADGRMGSVRTLVYEFAERDLYLENWVPVPIGEVRRPAPAVSKTESARAPAAAESPALVVPPASARPVQTVAAGLVVQATILFLSKPMDPGSAPYEDGLLYAKVKVDRVESGVYGTENAIVVFHAMEKRKLLRGGKHAVGEKVRLQLVKFSEAPAGIQSMQRSDDTEDFDLTPYFVQRELP